MNRSIIGALVTKDLALFFRNRFFAFITILALVFYIGIYLVMPKNINDSLEIGLVTGALPARFLEQLNDDGLELRMVESEAALREIILAGDLAVGVVLPSELLEPDSDGQTGRMNVLFAAEFPEEMKGAYQIFFEELAYMLAGIPLNIEAEEEILGQDMAGAQIPDRDRLLPLFAVFILMMETIGLASLISSEVETGTLKALMVTPMEIGGLFLGKGITGVALAFGQTLLLMLLTGGLRQQPTLIIAVLMVGSIMVTGLAFLIAAVGRDLLSVMGWGILALLLLAIPSFGVVFPGTMSDWVRLLPSYYMVESVHLAANFNIGWADLWQNVVFLLAFATLFVALGVMALKRKFS